MSGALSALGRRGCLGLLGLRNTTGSADTLPPRRARLMAGFRVAHKQKVKGSALTVGARALAKHCHRASDQWWGDGGARGTEAAKNAYAEGVIRRILDEASWLNQHTLPHDVRVFEVRVPEGYGARWSADGSEFRGFLEPHKVDGYLQKWRH